MTAVLPDKLSERTIGGLKVQRMADKRVDFLNMLLYGEPGVGKGQPANSLVLTPTGWREIDSLHIDDYVIGSDGFPTKVVGVFQRGILPTFRVTFNDRTSLVVDGEHLWMVQTHNDKVRGNGFRVVPTETLIDKLHQQWEIPMVEPIVFERTNNLDGYLMGVLLGDGNLTNTTPNFCPGDELVPAEVQRVLPIDAQMTRGDYEGRVTLFRILSKTVRDELKFVGLVGKHSYDKFVPTSYLFTSVEQRLALLQGLLDTDGEQNPKNKEVIFSSASPQLADAVAFIVKSLGGTARRSLGRDSFRVSVNLPKELSPFRARKFIPKEKYFPQRTIKSIEPSMDQSIVCIQVAASDGLYVTEHCIVTHNTTFIGTCSLVQSMCPVLLLDVEGGDLSLSTYPGIETVRITSYKQMQPIYDELYRMKHGYRTVAIDNLTELRYFSMGDVMLDAKATAKNPDNIDIDVPGKREWGKNSEQLRRVVRAFRDLPMHTIFTAHAKEEEQKNGLFKIKPSLPGKLADEVSGFVDLVLYYYMKLVGQESKRLMLTTKTAKENAKDRSGKLPSILEEPTMEMIMSYVLPNLITQTKESK